MRLCTRPRFDREAKGNFEMDYSNTKELFHLTFDQETQTNYFELKEGKLSSSETL